MKNLKIKPMFFLLTFLPAISYAGPPFITDDPEPVDYGHWEFYLASSQTFTRDGTDATLPHIEINYGIVPEVQLHIILPMEFIHENGGSRYGFSFTELGVKYRLLDETETVPQIGIFPLVELPIGTGSEISPDRPINAFFPVWVQKSWGSLTTYGGGGCWVNQGEKNQILMGWELQNDFSKKLTLGGEIYYLAAGAADTHPDTFFNLGGFINLNETGHILFSFGHTLYGAAVLTGYLAYQLTI
jgi:hypothetical protein